MMKQGNGRAAKRRMGLIFALLVMAVMVLGLSAAAAQGLSGSTVVKLPVQEASPGNVMVFPSH